MACCTKTQTTTWNKGLKRDGFILQQLVAKDFKLKYRRSVLGIVWSVLNPLLMMCVMAAVFSFFLRYDSIPNYPLYLILGNITWQLMADATNMGMTSILDASSLLKKVKINRKLFPIQKVLFATVNFFFSLIAVAIVMIYFHIKPTKYILLLPLLLLYLTVFCIGVSLILSSLAVFFRDVIHLWGVVLTAWMYMTPIFYPVSLLAGNTFMMTVMKCNPMYHYITYIRDIFLYNRLPGLHANLVCAGMALIALVIGIIVFRKTEHKFILYI